MKTYHLNNDIVVTQEQLDHWNEQLIKLETPQEIIAWSIVTFPHLFQTTAFGLTGLVTIDMLSKLSRRKYYMRELLRKNTTSLKIKPFTYKPDGCESEADFASNLRISYGENDDKYDYLAKVEPAHRACKTTYKCCVYW
nr:BPK_HP1_G0058310.mRNA.1.CDS.1 [Saccharomyces cerevisiae]